jgi:hypothetical protein
MVRTGLRWSEQAALSLFEVPLDRGSGGYQRFWLPPAIAKGGSARWVYVPASVIADLVSYAEIDRGSVGRLLRFLGSLAAPPMDPSQLTAEHLEGFFTHRAASNHESYAAMEVRDIGKLLRLPPLDQLVPSAAVEYANRRWDSNRIASKPGYSHRELARLVTTARRGIARIRDRILAGEQLLARHHTTPQSLQPADIADAKLLATLAATGAVPHPFLPFHLALPARREIAEKLFLTMPDLAPLLVLLVAVTGRNIETIKELPAEHRILDGRAVALRLTKRRRGIKHWTDTVTWEIGPPHRELHTPGGLYLLLHRLYERSREFSGSPASGRSGATATGHGSTAPTSTTTPSVVPCTVMPPTCVDGSSVTASPATRPQTAPTRRGFTWTSTGSRPASTSAASSRWADTCPRRLVATPSRCCSLTTFAAIPRR